jgi:dienelactone hydrolase
MRRCSRSTAPGDQDGDAGDCVPRLQQARDHGVPVQWHVFTGVGHAWDQTEFRTQGFTVYSGGKTIAVYNAEATQASRQRAFDFLAERFKQP